MYAGSVEMVAQNEHQRGVPYLYESGAAEFVVITELEAWAEEVFANLP